MKGKNMLFTFNYKYTENWIPPRCRKPRPGKFDGEMTVEVKEIDDSDAPVAAIWRRRERRTNERWEDVIEIRVHDGEFYIPSGEYHELYVWNASYFMNVDTIADTFVELMNEYSSMQRNIERANELSESIAIIGGKMYWKIPEPVWEISYGSCFTMFAYAKIPRKIGVDTGYDLHRCYNIKTDLDKLRVIHDDIVCDFNPHDFFEFLMPEAFTRDPQAVLAEKERFERDERKRLIKLLLEKLERDDDNGYYECGTDDSVIKAQIDFDYKRQFIA